MKERNIAVSIILTIVTCGIYGIIWFISLTDEVKFAAKDESLASGGVAFLLTLVTCGIYGIYWAYKIGELLDSTRSEKKEEKKNYSVIFLVLQIFGLGIVVYALAQNEINQMLNDGKKVA